MGKTNLQRAAEKAYKNTDLWRFLEQILSYYMSLRNHKYEDMAHELGYANKSSLSTRRNYFTPAQVERIIEILKIEDLDANRIRAKYWAALCETELDNCQFNRLYAHDTESIIRELRFENQQLKQENEILHDHASIAAEICADMLTRKNKKKP